jgi:ribonucleotide reductase alpha subunit
MCELFYKRALANEEITVFSPHEVPELEEAFGTSSFEEVYEKCERRHNIKRSKINAMKLFLEIVKERIETGRIYIMNIDHCNSHSSFLDKIRMSNLCLTGDTMVDVEIDGKLVSIQLKELNDAFKDGKSVSVLSKDVESGGIEYKPVTASAITAKNAKLMKITDEETGFSIRCTPEHKVFTKNRGYVEAKGLRSDDELDIK